MREYAQAMSLCIPIQRLPSVSIWVGNLKEWRDDHQRTLLETTMNNIKRLGGQAISRTFEHQVNGPDIPAAIFN
jgi:hypothetical protein